jgi:hypothetical protein
MEEEGFLIRRGWVGWVLRAKVRSASVTTRPSYVDSKTYQTPCQSSHALVRTPTLLV